MSAGLVQPGVQYPRQVPPPEGLPAGWTAVEFAYKSGTQLGKTYTRYNGPHKKDNLCTIKQVIIQDALYKGLSEEEAKKLGVEFDQRQQEKKRKLKEDREAQGYVKNEKRQEAIEAFRTAYGPLNGATVHRLAGWSVDSIFRATCNQTAVIYVNPEGRRFPTVMDVEAFFGVRVLRGEQVPEVPEARAKVTVDEKGRVINEARRDITVTRTAEDIQMEKEAKRAEIEAAAAWVHKKKAVRVITEESYQESATLVLFTIPSAAKSASETGETNEDALDAMAELDNDTSASANQAGAVESELQKEAAQIRELLAERGFQANTTLLALRGCAPSHELVEMLSGIFYQRPGEFNGKPLFQQVFRHETGSVACKGIFIYWSEKRERWKIGPLDDKLAPYAYLPGDKPRPTEGGAEQRWMVYMPNANVDLQASGGASPLASPPPSPGAPPAQHGSPAA